MTGMSDSRRARMTAMLRAANRLVAAYARNRPAGDLGAVLEAQAEREPGSVYGDSALYLLGRDDDREQPAA